MMNRRDFLETIAAATVGATLAPDALEARRVDNPKIYLFGFIAISTAGGLHAVFPSYDGMTQHRPFVVGSKSIVSDLIESGSKPINLSAIHEVHQDFSYGRWPWGACLTNNKNISVGMGPWRFDHGLRARLPKLRELSKKVDQRDRSLKRDGSFTVTLRGGNLRMPGHKSRCPGVADGVEWMFKHGETELLERPMHVTDMAVFVSSSPLMVVSRDGESLTMGAGDVLWLFNLPLLHPRHDSTQVIEHVGDWFALLDPPLSGVFTAETTANVGKVPRENPFKHPCLENEDDLSRARKYMEQMHRSSSGGNQYLAPPDSDPCIMVEI